MRSADTARGDAARGVPGDYESYRATSFFSSLDGLRCLSILAVIWVHTGVRVENLDLARNGHLGVDLFFAISGFLITTLLLREKERWGTISLQAFYVRRSLRIFPLYYTVVALYVIVVWALERETAVGREFFANLPYFLSYTSNWFVPLEGRVIFYFAWSLATEEQFYLVWPLLEKVLRGWQPVWLAAAVLVLREVVQLGVHAGAIEGGDLAVRIFLSIHPAILGGVILAHVLHDRRTFGLAATVLGARVAAPVILACMLVAIELRMPVDGVRALMVLLVGAVVIHRTNGLAWLLTWRPVSYLGVISYGMYLLHMLSFNAAKRFLSAAGLDNAWLAFPATVLVAALAATVSYRYYESWFLKLKSRFSRVPPARSPSGFARGQPNETPGHPVGPLEPFATHDRPSR